MKQINKKFFNLEKIMDSGQCFRVKKINTDKTLPLYRFITKNRVLYLNSSFEGEEYTLCNDNSFNNSEKNILGNNNSLAQKRNSLIWAEDKFWIDYFDLLRDYSTISSEIENNDCFLQNAASYSQGIRILNQDKWETLISFIISQRKSIPAIKTSVEKLCKYYGKQLITPYETIYTFPSATEIFNSNTSLLEKCSLGYRLPYIKDACNFVLNNASILDIIDAKPTDELLNQLMKIKGVGKKVANCVALFSYKRGELAPVDVWIKRVIDLVYNGKNPFNQYGKNAGIIQQYAFYYITKNKNTITSSKS